MVIFHSYVILPEGTMFILIFCSLDPQAWRRTSVRLPAAAAQQGGFGPVLNLNGAIPEIPSGKLT